MEFRIKALDNAHAIVACVIDAVDEADARRQLALKEFRVISLSPVRHLRLLARAPQLQLAVFSQQLVSLLDAGLSLVEALEALAERESTTGAHRKGTRCERQDGGKAPGEPHAQADPT